MKNLDIKLYKIKILDGKEEIAKEWLNYLKENSEEATKTLINEKVYLETYFISKEQDSMFVYLFLAANDIDNANEIARQSTNPIDIQHIDYMKSCVDFESGLILDSCFYMENLEATQD